MSGYFLGKFPEAVPYPNYASAKSQIGSKIFAGWRLLTENEDLNLDYTKNPLNIDTSDPLAAQTADFVFEAVYVTGTPLAKCNDEGHWYSYHVSGIVNSDGQSRSVVVGM